MNEELKNWLALVLGLILSCTVVSGEWGVGWGGWEAIQLPPHSAASQLAVSHGTILWA